MAADAVGRWLDDNWDPDRPLGQWWDLLADSGWGFPSWPEQWFGRDLPVAEARAARAELSRRGVVGPPSGVAAYLVAPTLLVLGTESQKARYLPGIAKGSETWCQLFSEPGAGSDLASIAMRAVRDGEEFVLNGQKVWTTGAQFADFAILLARTDPDLPKHRGLTYFAFGMDQPGVDVRPLVEMTGDENFNEVFITDGRVGAEDVLGEYNRGWGAAMATLSHERDSENAAAGGGGGHFLGRPDLAMSCAEFQKPRSRAKPDGFELSLDPAIADLALRVAGEFGRTHEPTTRQGLADVYMQQRLMELNGRRANANAQSGQAPGPEASTGKIMASDLGRLIRDVGSEIAGPAGQLVGEEAPQGGELAAYSLYSPGLSLAGGTDEVQRNIIGERVLGLPKEPDVSRDVPYRELKVGTQRDS